MIHKYKSHLIINEEEESSFVDYIIICSKMCYGKSIKDFRELAFGISQIDNIVVPEIWKIYNKAGVDWMHGLLKRHPHVRICQPEARAVCPDLRPSTDKMLKFVMIM